MPPNSRPDSPTRPGSARAAWCRLLLAGIALAALLPGAAHAEDLVLDQEAVDPDSDPNLYWLGSDLVRTQTFTVGISGTLGFVEVKVSGGATATFEIHPTTGGLPVLGSTPLGSATVSFDIPSSSGPVYYPIDFTAEQIPVEAGEVLAIVSPGGVNTPVPGNTPFWHRLRGTTDYLGGDSYWTNSTSSTEYDGTNFRDFGFRTYVYPGTPIPNAIKFDADDRSTRPVLLHPESTPCPLTGVNGLADPDCEIYAEDPGAAFAVPPIRGDIVAWAGNVATIVVSADEVADYLTQHLGVVPIATSDMQLYFAINETGTFMGGHLLGSPGDYFFTATLPTPQGPLDFTWWNRSQNDRGFEASVLVGTAFEKRVIASCATEGDAPVPVDTNGICFLQKPASPVYGTLYETLTVYAQKDATFPLEDYSPELDTLDFVLTEYVVPDVPSVRGGGLTLAALLLGAIGIATLATRRARQPRASSLLLLAIGGAWLFAAAESARAEVYEGVLELGISESFAPAGSPVPTATWHRALRTENGRIPLPSVDTPPGFSHGARVRIEGTLDAGLLEPASISEAEATSPETPTPQSPVAPATDTLGEQRTLVTLLNFTNDTSQPYTVAEVRAYIIDELEPTSTASYIDEASYGRAWLSGGVAGWLPVGYDDTSCLLWWSGGGAATLIDAMDPLIDFSAWDRWVIVIPHNSNCGFVGYSSLGKETWTTDDGTVDFSRIILNGTSSSTPAVTAHELGHSIGALQHSLDYECGGVEVDDECSPGSNATDRYDVIASTVDYGHYSAPNKEALHWLDSDLVEVTGTGGTYFLEPYESAAAGTKVLRIPVSWTLDDLHAASAYYLSYRTDTGFDAIYPELATDGVMIQLDGDYFEQPDPPVVGASRLLDLSPGGSANQVTDSSDVTLGVGSTFTDSFHGISVEVIGPVGNTLEVAVSLTQTCGNGSADPNVGEACDGADLAGQTCDSIGFSGGALACDSVCGFDTSLCGAARCGPDHSFDDVSQTCTVELPLDPSERGMWRNHNTWADTRSSLFAQKFSDEYGYLFLSNLESASYSNIYRRTLPFDTSSIPDGVTLVSASLHLKVLESSYPTINNEPTGSDQLVLVQPTLASPPIAALDDFDTIGLLDLPVEGAPRIDIGDLMTGQDFESQFDLNAAGLSWIDPTGISLFGLRGGFDVDDVIPPGQTLDFRIYLRGPQSPHAGPRLSVTYQAVPEPTLVQGLAAGSLTLAGLSRARRSRRSTHHGE